MIAQGKTFLIVDDEATNRTVVQGIVNGLGHKAVFADSGPTALELLDDTLDLVLLDVMMPGMDGYEVARQIRERYGMGDLPIIMLTALSSREDRLRAAEAGANDFISKPIDKTEFRVRTQSLLQMKEARDQVRHYQAALEEKVAVRTQALEMALDNLRRLQRDTRNAHLDTVRRLAIAAEYKDEGTGRHIERMSRYTALMAVRYGLQDEEVEFLRHAAPMHDVGKLGIPDAILLKPGPLDPGEWEIMKTHTTIGGRILEKADSDLMQAGRTIALSHHERWDGSGYPVGLAGAQIPLYGRICAVVDVFDALTSKRPYKPAYPVQEALEIMRQGRGRHFDPHLLDLFLSSLDGILEIQKRFAD